MSARVATAPMTCGASIDVPRAVGIVDHVYHTMSQWFTYDALNRITSAKRSTTADDLVLTSKQTFTIDAWGNLVEIADSGTQLLGVLANTKNQLVSFGGLGQFAYDTVGNLTKGRNGPQMNYDANNMLVSTGDTAAPTDTFAYDAAGQRVRKATGATSTEYVHFSGNIIAEKNQSGALTDYIFAGSDRVAEQGPGGLKFYIKDHLGSSSVVASDAGAPLCTMYYTAFGEVESQQGSDCTHYKFTGKERDSETGLDLMGARYFGSSMGRFMQADPIYIANHRLLDPQLLNLYQYGRNNPLRFTDVTGLDVALDCSKVSSEQCNQSVADLNKRKDAQFQVSRNEKTGLLEVQGKVDPSKLSKGESALYNAITDTNHHATLELVSQSDFVHFGRFDGNGHNTLDASDLKWLGNASQQAAGEVIAHEALEAFDSTFGNAPYGIAHEYANQFFGEATNPFVGRCNVCNPAWNLRDWSFGRIGETFQVKTIQTPVPDANRYAYEPGKIVEVKKAQEQ